MSFSILASGVTGHGLFNYSKDNCLDQDDFDPPLLLSLLDKIGPGSFKKKLKKEIVSEITKVGVMKLAEIETVHLVDIAVSSLAIKCNRGQINVSCYHEKWYWADTSSFVSYYVGGGDPGRDFLKTISPGLVETKLNNFGVLIQMALLITKYEIALQHSKKPAFLNIIITH